MKTKTFEIEISRTNVTPSQFLAYVRHSVDRKGGELLRGDLRLDYFRAGNDLNFDITHEDGTHEVSVSKPYEMQTFISWQTGAKYNEIAEFTFDDEKTGHGYYYLLNVAEEEETPEEAREDAQRAIEATKRDIENSRPRSAWGRGVKAYAVDLLGDLAEAVAGGWVEPWELSRRDRIERALLNGAGSWSAYSWGGCSLIYDKDIARTLCTASELKRTKDGERRPNPSEEWLDTQARALTQAARMICDLLPAWAEAADEGCPCW